MALPSRRVAPGRLVRGLLLAAVSLLGAACSTDSAAPSAAVVARPPAPPPTAPLPFPVMLGIDTLEADGFAAVRGKNIALLTHSAAVNRAGVTTLDVLRRAPNVKLVALFGEEHGVNNEFPAGKNYEDYVDRQSGLKVYSLYTGRADAAGKVGRPTKEQLKGIDALVVDLQDIGVRSYTHSVRMRYAIEGCFEHGVEVIVLDRPNPLGGLKVDGPPLDRALRSGVGGYSVPYVHGLTMGEMALMAKEGYGVLDVADKVRAAGRLTVIPMRGWTRSMRWPDTGLKFISTSPNIQDFDAVIGYAMVGLGTERVLKGFSHGIQVDGQPRLQFRALGYPNQNPDQLVTTLNGLRLPGLAFRKMSVKDRAGRDVNTVYVDVTNWEAWQPTQLSFHMMRITLQNVRPNPALDITPGHIFPKLVGSADFVAAIKRDAGRIDIETYLADWKKRNEVYLQQVRKYWLYK